MKNVFAVCGLLCSCALFAQVNLEFTALESTFEKPLGLISAGDASDDIYILGKDGPVHRYNLQTKEKTLFLDFSDRLETRGEAGLLSGAFHPNQDSNYFYLLYTAPAEDPSAKATIQLSRFAVGKNGALETTSERILLAIDKPDFNQSGGGMAFGPHGYLYIGTGDGGGRSDVYDNAQNPASLLGKLLRIDVNRQENDKEYAIPSDNPFVNDGETLNEIWSLGLRNPFGISFDPKTGDLYVGDKANSYWQEINHQPAGNAGGQNYGWNCMEGFEAFSPASERFCGTDLTAYSTPLLAFGRDDHAEVIGGSVTAGHVYRGADKRLQGKYIFGDFFTPSLFIMDPAQPHRDSIVAITDTPIQNLTTLGRGNDGTMYAVDYNGSVFKIEVAEPTPVRTPNVERLAVFPNPTTTVCTVAWSAPGDGLIRAKLVGADGRILRQWQAVAEGGSDRINFDLQNVPSGFYTLQLTHGQQVAVGKLSVR